MAQHYLTLEHQSAIIAFIRGDLPKAGTSQGEAGSEMDVDHHSHTTISSSSTDANIQFKEFDETVDVLHGGVQALGEDAQRLRNESGHLQHLLETVSKDLPLLKSSVQEQNAYLDGLRPGQEMLAQEVASIKQKIEESQFVSYDGTYTWKIPNFSQKIGKIFIDIIDIYIKTV